MAPRILTEAVTLPDQLTVARAASVPLVVLLYAWDFPHNEYWATALFCVAMATDWLDGRIARRRGVTSPLGSLLDPIADKVLVLAVLVMLIEDGVWPGWMVAAIVAREILISGLRLAAIERGVVIAARDLGKLKTWAQAIAAALGGFAAAGAWDDSIAWWALLVALVLTWVSGLDYARLGAAPAARHDLIAYAVRRYASNSATKASKVRPNVDAKASCHSTPRAIASR